MSGSQVKCQYCGETFDSKEEMKGHARKHHPNCESCGNTFTSQEEMQKRLRAARRERNRVLISEMLWQSHVVSNNINN